MARRLVGVPYDLIYDLDITEIDRMEAQPAPAQPKHNPKKQTSLNELSELVSRHNAAAMMRAEIDRLRDVVKQKEEQLAEALKHAAAIAERLWVEVK